MSAFRYRDDEIAGRLGGMAGRFAAVRLAEENARKFSAEERQKLAKEGKALSDGSYPIPDAASLKDAETLAKSGHGNVSAATALIKKRAKQLGVKHNLDGKEKGAADDSGIDAQVRKAIEAAIDLQRQDPDLNSHDQDRRVLDLLTEALHAQLRDEATDTPSSGSGMY